MPKAKRKTIRKINRRTKGKHSKQYLEQSNLCNNRKLRKKLGALLWAAVFPKLFVKDQHKTMANVKNDTLQKFDRAIADGYNVMLVEYALE